MPRLVPPRPSSVVKPFSRRQREVLELLIDGRTSKEIGYDLGIDDRTVDYHVAEMCAKAGVWSRRELVVFALRGGRSEAA